jgi:hypothetical protein
MYFDCFVFFTANFLQTLCVASTINGGGKSHFIKTLVCESQHQLAENHHKRSLNYVKIPIRESTTPKKLIDLLLSQPVQDNVSFAFHIEVGHIIPAAANTMLFQLLVVGVVQDPVSCRVFHRRSTDRVYLEIPNSLNNKTAIALRICSLLPTEILSVSASSLKLTRPVFADSYWTQLVCVENTELINVCKWLRALKRQKLLRNSGEYSPEFCPELDGPISASECFDLLSSTCSAASGPSPLPSFSIFNSFIVFTHMQFAMLSSYELMNNGILDQMEGLEKFRHVFLHLLVETSKDFSLRSVAQVPDIGPPPNAADATGGLLQDAPAVNISSLQTVLLDADENISAAPPPPRRLVRQTSSELRQATLAAEAEAPHRLVRQTSEEMVARFQTMISWEQSDHPIVSFKRSAYGGVEGVDILSLNPQYVNRYINGSLKANLEASGFNFFARLGQNHQ